MQACKYCYATNVELLNGACSLCFTTIKEARTIDDKETELWNS